MKTNSYFLKSLSPLSQFHLFISTSSGSHLGTQFSLWHSTHLYQVLLNHRDHSYHRLYIAFISSVVLYFSHQFLHALSYDFWLSNIQEKNFKELDHMRALNCISNAFNMLFMIFHPLQTRLRFTKMNISRGCGSYSI